MTSVCVEYVDGRVLTHAVLLGAIVVILVMGFLAWTLPLLVRCWLKTRRDEEQRPRRRRRAAVRRADANLPAYDDVVEDGQVSPPSYDSLTGSGQSPDPPPTYEETMAATRRTG